MRTAQVERNTKETKIKIKLNLDGGEVNAKTGIGFFDHMLTAFGVHGGFGNMGVRLRHRHCFHHAR